MSIEARSEGKMQLIVEFRQQGTRSALVTVPASAIVSVEQGGSTLRILQDNVPIAVFNDVLLWRRDDQTELQRL